MQAAFPALAAILALLYGSGLRRAEAYKRCRKRSENKYRAKCSTDLQRIRACHEITNPFAAFRAATAFCRSMN